MKKALTAAPGVGKKLAQRILLELKDKLGAAGFKDKFDLVDQTTAVTGSTVPFHPGAEQYFKEIGAM